MLLKTIIVNSHDFKKINLKGCDETPQYKPGEIITINPHMGSTKGLPNGSQSFLVLDKTSDNAEIDVLPISRKEKLNIKDIETKYRAGNIIKSGELDIFV